MQRVDALKEKCACLQVRAAGQTLVERGEEVLVLTQGCDQGSKRSDARTSHKQYACDARVCEIQVLTLKVFCRARMPSGGFPTAAGQSGFSLVLQRVSAVVVSRKAGLVEAGSNGRGVFRRLTRDATRARGARRLLAHICKHVQSTTGKGPSAGSAEGRASASTIAEGNQKGCHNVTMVARRAEGRASASTNVYRWKEPVLVEKQRKKNCKNLC